MSKGNRLTVLATKWTEIETKLRQSKITNQEAEIIFKDIREKILEIINGDDNR